jgi:hypothetical protein
VVIAEPTFLACGFLVSLGSWLFWLGIMLGVGMWRYRRSWKLSKGLELRGRLSLEIQLQRLDVAECFK